MTRWLLAGMLAIIAGPALAQQTGCVNATPCVQTNVFTPSGAASLAVSPVSGSVAFPSVGASLTAVIVNTGSTTAFIVAGNSQVAATLAGTPIAPGQTVAISQGYNTNLAAITASGTTTLSIQSGTGVPVIVTGQISAAPLATTPTTQTAGTVTTGGTFQQVLGANPSRTSCLIQNTSAHTAYVYWLATGTPSLTNAVQVQAGASFFCIAPSGAPIRTAIQWTTSTTGDAFVVTENQ